MYAMGEQPGKGEYVCTRCGKVIVLDSDDQELPQCPRCGNKTFNKK